MVNRTRDTTVTSALKKINFFLNLLFNFYHADFDPLAFLHLFPPLSPLFSYLDLSLRFPLGRICVGLRRCRLCCRSHAVPRQAKSRAYYAKGNYLRRFSRRGMKSLAKIKKIKKLSVLGIHRSRADGTCIQCSWHTHQCSADSGAG